MPFNELDFQGLIETQQLASPWVRRYNLPPLRRKILRLYKAIADELSISTLFSSNSRYFMNCAIADCMTVIILPR